MAEFMRSSDAFSWSMERDPGLRSTIVTLVLLDRSPDWGEIVERFDRLCRTLPMFRQKVLPSPAPAPPRWELDPDFDLGFHMRRVDSGAIPDFDVFYDCLVDGFDEVLALADRGGSDTEKGQP